MKRVFAGLLMFVAANVLAATCADTPGLKVVCHGTNTCVMATDQFSLSGTQPTHCKLYRNAVLFQDMVAVVPGTVDNPGAPAGSVACHFVVDAPLGIADWTATAWSATSSESGPSNTCQFTAVEKAPAAPVLRLQNPIVVQ